MRRLVCLALIAGLLMVSGCGGGNSPEALAKEMVAALLAGDMQKIKSMEEPLKKFSEAEKKAFEKAVDAEVQKQIGNDPVKAMQLMGKMFEGMGKMGGMPGMPGGKDGMPEIPGFGGKEGIPNPFGK
jgi:hypothetical protein